MPVRKKELTEALRVGVKTLVLQEDTGKVRVEKKGSTFMFISSKAVVSGDEITGRLEDRWGRTN